MLDRRGPSEFNSAVLRISAESRNFSFGTRRAAGRGVSSSPSLDEGRGGTERKGGRDGAIYFESAATRSPFMTDERRSEQMQCSSRITDFWASMAPHSLAPRSSTLDPPPLRYLCR